MTTRRWLPLAGVAALGCCGYTAHAHRPQHTPTFERTGLYSPPTREESALLKLTRTLTIGSVTLLSKLFIEYMNDFRVVGDLGNYAHLLHQIKNEREHERGLITVSNHTSVFDDPVLQSSIVGFLPSDKHRWGVCKHSICFKNAFVSSFTSAGKVLPIEVGAGLEQSRFKAVARRLVDGEWVHIYPEAACNQTGRLGCEREEGKMLEIGRLKWGVGKLIAKMERAPVIVPYFHLGMEQVKPQDGSKEKRLKDPWYVLGRTGKKIRVIVGKPVLVQDLLDEYRQSCKPASVNGETGELQNWDDMAPTRAELELYSKITKRIELALLELEREAMELYEK